ncbi:MAG: aldehyde dehydrogenase family protein [Myxococcota bacterium]
MPDIVSPIDGQIAYQYERLGLDAARAAVEEAAAAQQSFRATPLAERVALCRRMLHAYEAREDQYAEQITRMMGKPLAHARGEFQGPMKERVGHLCTIAADALADEHPEAIDGFTRFIRREPVGVVFDIAAWNYPLIIAINVVVPAVLAGNAVVIKHAHQTALVAQQLAQAFADAGAPAGLVQAMPVDHTVAASLIGQRRFGYVSFTGSVRGGHEVYRAVAANDFIGCGLELGGKDGALVLPDCDLPSTVDNLVDAAFFNAGQSCCGIERIYVHADVYDSFVEAYVAQARAYVLGNPLDEGTNLGPMVRADAVQHVRAQVEQATTRGAQVVVGDADYVVPDLSDCYLAPHVLTGVNHSMNLMTEETFGPAIGIMKYTSVDEGVALMNDSHYGLTGSVWTTDDARAAALAERIDAGTVFQNRCDYLDPGLAWTGVKDSGHGASLSRLGFLSVTRPKSFHLRQST